MADNEKNENQNDEKTKIRVVQKPEDAHIQGVNPQPKNEDGQNQTTRHNQQANLQSKNSFMTFETSTSDDFAALLNESSPPERRFYQVGDQVEGTIFNITDKNLYIDLGSAYEAIAPRDLLTEKEYEVGQPITLYVVSKRDGALILGEQIRAEGASLEAIEQAFATQANIEGRVDSVNKGGFIVMIGDVEAFCPVSQIELSYTEDPQVHVGEKYDFRVTRVSDDGRSVVVSRAVILREIEDAARRKLLEEVKIGDTVTGRVTKITDFGAFVDLSGVEGLIHISELSYSNPQHPSEVVKEGQEVQVEIVSMGQTKKGLRIGLSTKRLEKDPWSTVLNDFPVGTEVNGEVVRVESFGAFVALSASIEGLVHISEMSWTKRIRHASDVVKPGDKIVVRVIEVDPHRRRINLTMKSPHADPWADVTNKLKLGDEVTGTIDKVEDFGVFVILNDFEVTALIPRSEMELARNETPHAKASKGAEITAKVLNIDKPRRRLALTLRDNPDFKRTNDQPSNTPSEIFVNEGNQLGTFADILKKQLDKNKN